MWSVECEVMVDGVMEAVTRRHLFAAADENRNNNDLMKGNQDTTINCRLGTRT